MFLGTLFTKKFNWGGYVLALLVIRVVFLDLSFISFLAVMIALYQFLLLFDSIGTLIPTRHLLGFFMCVQYFVGPVLAYNGLDQYQYFQYRMKIPETEYFSYAMPAVLFFILGVHSIASKDEVEKVSEVNIAKFYLKNPLMPYYLIGIGFLSSVISSFFSADLAFVFYLLGGLKFIGLFILILGSQQFNLLSMILVIGSIISSSFNEGMFHDLLTWLIYTIAVFAIRFRFNILIKVIGIISLILLVTIIQVLKGSFRDELKNRAEDSGTETFLEVYRQQEQTTGVLNFENLAQSNVRINQGFIITHIMDRVPNIIPFQQGEEMYLILEAAILPRVLAPNKLNAGDQQLFVKYSGIKLTKGTSMGLSSLGDAYINFGKFGGVVFMYFLGLLYSKVLDVFYRKSFDFPMLSLFVPLVFYFPIRPDCELQTLLGHLVKSIFLVWVIFLVFGKYFRQRDLDAGHEM